MEAPHCARWRLWLVVILVGAAPMPLIGLARPALAEGARTGPAAAVWPARRMGGTSQATRRGSSENGNTLVVNVKDFGAVGNGRTQDAAAIQAAINAASKTGGKGEVFIPAGYYLINKPLVIAGTQHLILGGAGGGGFGVPFMRAQPRDTGTYLIWAGKSGGTLLKMAWSGSNTIENLVLEGCDYRRGNHAPRAGILLHMVSRNGGGTMIQHISGVSFSDAKVGLQMGGGSETLHNTDSDILFDYLTFRNLDTAFRTTHEQAVDYLFNFVFGLQCGTVFDFKRGGDVMVNNAQLTSCSLAVNIQGGGMNSGTYLFNSMRCEGLRRGTKWGSHAGRWQILRAYPGGEALVRFTNFDDVQWYWFKMPDPGQKRIPLCSIGPKTTVVFNTSIFSGPIARLTGTRAAPALLELHNCDLNYITPGEALAANAYGYFRVVRCRDGGGKLFPDLIKWPTRKRMRLRADTAYVGSALREPAK
jgi:hypothetical protein